MSPLALRTLLSCVALAVSAYAFQLQLCRRQLSTYRCLQSTSLDTGIVSPATNFTSPYPPTRLPWYTGFGFLWHSVRGRAHKYQDGLRKKYGNSYIIWNKYVVISDVAAIRDVLEMFPRDPDTCRGYRAFFGSDGGLLAAPWKKWQVQRRKLSPPFSAPAVRNIQVSGVLENCTKPFLDVVDSVAAASGAHLDMDALFQDVTMDVIGTIVLNRTFGMCEQWLTGDGGKDSTFQESTKILMQESVRQMSLPPEMLQKRPRFLLRKTQKARLYVDNFLEDCISTRELEGAGKVDQSGDLLQILLEAESNGDMTRDQVKTQLYIFLFAGHETTAHTLSYMLWEISQNSTLQELLHEETVKVLPSMSDDMTAVNHNACALSEQMPWLDRTFSETLRKHPVTPTGVARMSPESETPNRVGNGLEIPPRTIVSIPSWSLHRNEEYWPDPLQFDPSRFVEAECAKRNTHAFQAFSGGPRNCLGNRLARAESLHVVAPILRRYVVSCDEVDEPDDFVALTRRPRRGIRFQFQRRKK